MLASGGLNLREGVLLSHVLVDAAARENSARVLFIKGPHQQRLGLRPERQSVDTDALVHPADFEALREALGSYGWTRRVDDSSPHVLPFHSVALTHASWPCEIDLHHHFPGFFAPDNVVFEALWERRLTDRIAERDLPVCDLAGDILIAALHAERAPTSKRTDLEFLIDVVRGRLDNAMLVDLAQLAAQTGCADSLRSFLDAVGAPSIGTGTTSAEDLYAWSLLTASERVRGIGWVHELRHAPLRDRPRILWHAVVLTEEEVRSQYPHAPAGRVGLLKARWWRLKATARDVPKALRALR